MTHTPDRPLVTRKHQFSALDAFRGLVSLTVCLHHTQNYWGITVPRSPVAVDLFFLLGGFVVAFSYERRLLEGRISFTDFVLIRLIRLYPLYLLSLVMISVPVLAALFLHHTQPDYIIVQYVWAAVLGVVMLPMHVTDSVSVYTLNVVYWSLFWALATNFAYAWLIHRLSDRVLLAIAAVAGLFLTACVAVNHGINLGPVWGWLSFAGGLLRAVFGMAVGVLLFRNYNTVPRWVLGGGGYLLPLALITLVLWGPSIGPGDWVVQLLAVFLVFPWCIMRAARGAQPPGDKLLQAVGFVSYPIYVLHEPLAHILEVITAKRMVQYAPISGIVMVVILVVLALVVDRKVDRPIRGWLTARAFGRPAVGIPAAA
jgi:peptidoglycan/LPS O-acetylase OafA/YrhL